MTSFAGRYRSLGICGEAAVKSFCVIWVVAVTAGPNIPGGRIACLTSDDTGPEGAEEGAGEGLEQESATTTTPNPIAKSASNFVFIFAFFPTHDGNTSVDLVSIW